MKYRNDTASDLWLPGIGEVKAGAILETDAPLCNANFSLVEEKAQEKPKENKSPEPKTT